MAFLVSEHASSPGTISRQPAVTSPAAGLFCKRFVIDPCPVGKAQQAIMFPQTTQRACQIRPGETVMYKQERIWDIDSDIVIIGAVYMLTLLTSIAVVGGIL
jgi:hypothetical protein